MKPSYRAVMSGDGGLIVEKYGSWWAYLVWGTRWYPVSSVLKDHSACDSFVENLKLRQAGKSNQGKIVKKYY